MRPKSGTLFEGAVVPEIGVCKGVDAFMVMDFVVRNMDLNCARALLP